MNETMKWMRDEKRQILSLSHHRFRDGGFGHVRSRFGG